MPKKSEIARRAGEYHCPYCRCFLPPFIPKRKYLDKDGHRINIAVEWQRKQRAAFEECGKCGERWPLWTDYESVPSSNISVVETSRSEEFIGDETRRIENETSATVQRTLRASKEWTCQIELDVTRTSLNSSKIGLPMQGASLELQVQNSLQKRYSISMGETNRFEEEVVVTVPGNTRIAAIFIWKRIWQNGYAELDMGQVRVPFKLCVGITFDLRQDKIQ